MPRTSLKKTSTPAPTPEPTPSTSTSDAVTGDASEEQFFPYVVSSFKGKLPGQDGYDEKKDRLLIGFQIGQRNIPMHLPKDMKIEEVTPYDFLTNPKTGKRPGAEREPWGTGNHDLSEGISDYTPIPPVEIWGNGCWLGDAIWDQNFSFEDLTYTLKEKIKKLIPDWPKNGTPQEIWNIWVCSGEGTPSNNLYQLYELPKEQAGRDKPQHPAMWPESLRRKKTYSYGQGSSFGENGWSYGGTQTKPAVKTFTPPMGVRMRCPECGHWYAYQDLITHSGVCGDPEKLDWAIMCHTECGCRTLDDSTRPKDGFPRPKKEAEQDGTAEAVEPATP